VQTPTVVISVVSVVERYRRQKRLGLEAERLDELPSELRIDVRGLGASLGRLAREAHARYGQPAGLNFGDCFTYALGKARDDTLLFKGDDFPKTDIVPAWRP
jgi:ribonuclease VapC